jgi:hypothetical protein
MRKAGVLIDHDSDRGTTFAQQVRYCVTLDLTVTQTGQYAGIGNLQCLCRTHHRLKTHTDWQVIHLGQGVLQWISPSGRIYYTTLEDP